jgi:hypothetical protein
MFRGRARDTTICGVRGEREKIATQVDALTLDSPSKARAGLQVTTHSAENAEEAEGRSIRNVARRHADPPTGGPGDPALHDRNYPRRTRSAEPLPTQIEDRVDHARGARDNHKSAERAETAEDRTTSQLKSKVASIPLRGHVTTTIRGERGERGGPNHCAIQIDDRVAHPRGGTTTIRREPGERGGQSHLATRIDDRPYHARAGEHVTTTIRGGQATRRSLFG